MKKFFFKEIKSSKLQNTKLLIRIGSSLNLLYKSNLEYFFVIIKSRKIKVITILFWTKKAIYYAKEGLKLEKEFNLLPCGGTFNAKQYY
ncbi:hypothetical protein DRF57_19540 [Chryseobacterium rhizosphaerae]|uniref:Uncharacterized protein n=1 Tax=Chryseobacterium rhizosphaerae TaxID=395937 RepID=A0ABX9IFM2_9FLAO|nr:hypothetical protein DRF57_19540 [Chryseobacterium rhizosphaerae]GEN66166.1 hypothetical protein CRH01_07340 [Chryseobacterium rhizosphaerae]